MAPVFGYGCGHARRRDPPIRKFSPGRLTGNESSVKPLIFKAICVSEPRDQA